MEKYNEQDLNTAAKNSYQTVGHLIVILKNLDGDLGGPEDEIEGWIDMLRDFEGILEYIEEMSQQ